MTVGCTRQYTVNLPRFLNLCLTVPFVFGSVEPQRPWTSGTVCSSSVFHFQTTVSPFLIVSLPLTKKSSWSFVVLVAAMGGPAKTAAMTTKRRRSFGTGGNPLSRGCFWLEHGGLGVSSEDRLEGLHDLALRRVGAGAVE